MIEHINIIIKGPVSDKGFALPVMRKASESKITGHFRYMDNNTILIEAEGTCEDLDTFINWCKTGYFKESIEQITSANSTLKNYKEFIIHDKNLN